MRKFSYLPKTVFLIVFIFIIYTLQAPVQAAQYTPAQTPKKTLSSQEKRQQLIQEAPAASTEISAKCQEILSFVNSAQTPADPNLKGFLKIIARNRKYLPVFDNSQKSIYCILSSWVYYFDNKQDRALKQASECHKANPKNSNAVKTRLAISIIYRDYASAIGALTEQSTNKNTTKTDEAESQSYQQTSESDIQLDINTVRTELLGKVFDFHPEPVGAGSAPWQSASRLTCALLWKIDANELDSFAPTQIEKPASETNEPNAPASPAPESVTAPSGENMPPPQTEPEQQGTTYQQQIQASDFGAFSQLKSLFEQNKKTVFAGINLNNPEKIKNIEGWFAKNPQTWQTFLLSPQGQQKMVSLLGDPNRSILLIVGPDSTIRYVGDVNGFLPQMIISNILANPQEFAEPNEPNEPNKPSQPLTAVAESNLPPAPAESNQPPQLPAEQNTPPVLTADVNKTDVNTPQPQQPKADANTVSAPAKQKQKANEDFSVADDYQAETLLSNARTFLKIGNRLPSHEYRNPIEWCRQVMKDYPNTKYAQEAQMLLRNVPKDHRAQYNITDEELGL